MADPFVAEIRIFPFNFAPKGWAFCNGQLLPISQNTALFSLLGTTYGGDGKSTFALPDLQGAVPMHPGQGPGLSLYDLGQESGSETVTLLTSEIPIHNHGHRVSNSTADEEGLKTPKNNTTGVEQNIFPIYGTTAPLTPMSASALSPSGGDLPHNNMMPYLTFSFCIALLGEFPPRS